LSKKGEITRKEVKRLFFAVDLPLKTLSSAQDLIDKFGIPADHVRWVHVKNLHVSLKFLGDVDVKTIPSLCEKAEEAVSGFGAMSLSIEGMGLFPNHTKPKVIWFGIKGEVKELACLELSLAKNIECLGFPGDERPFTPHLTIGRVKSGNARGELIRLVHNNHELKVGEAPVKAVHLYESRLGPGGSVYTKVESFSLSDDS
jgi:2'-5' RNA ligase